MKVNTLIKYKFTADYYDYDLVATTDGVGNEFKYYYHHTIKCNVFLDGTGRLFMHVPSPLRTKGRIANLRDQNGEVVVGSVISDVGYGYEITGVEPVMNVFGTRDELRYTLLRL